MDLSPFIFFFVQDSQGRLHQVILPAVPDASDLDENGEPRIKHPIYEYRYDAAGNQTHIIDPNGHTTIFTFDAQGRQLTRTLPLGTDELENLPAGTDARTSLAGVENAFTEGFWYDEPGRQVKHKSFEGVVTLFVYDDSLGQTFTSPVGRLIEKQFVSESGVMEERWRFAYDTLGRQSQVTRETLNGTVITESLTTNYIYDTSGRLSRVVSPEGAVNYEFDALGRKTRTYTGTNPSNPIDDWTYTYDSLSRLSTVTTVTRDSSPVDTIVGEPDGINLIEPEFTTYHYDLLGNLDWQLSRQVITIDLWPNNRSIHNVVANYEYDSLNRLDKLSYYEPYPPIVIDLPFKDDTLVAEFDYDVRADGKRTGVTEKLYARESTGPIVEQTNRFDWDYDALGRLIAETLDTNVDDLVAHSQWPFNPEDSRRPLDEYVDNYEFDLVGNRIRKTTDYPQTAEIDQAIEYLYDANDRLLSEELDTDDDGLPDQTTTYGYDHTQQTSKHVVADVLQSAVLSIYDLQGRLFVTTNIDFASDGTTIERREMTSFDYDHTGIRVSSRTQLEKLDPSSNDLVLRYDLKTTYLVDHQNFTGYQQVIREQKADADTGNVIHEAGYTAVYTLGHDVLSQWSSGEPPTKLPEEGTSVTIPVGSHLFVHDGHGSVRGLLPRGATAIYGAFLLPEGKPALDKTLTFDAYGNAAGFNPLYAGTSLLYSGEWFQVEIDQQYLRARFYDAVTGTFDRLDDFFGNIYLPQSLHKYTYSIGDPVGFTDPSGRSIIAVGIISLGAGMIGGMWARGHYDNVAIGVGAGIMATIGMFWVSVQAGNFTRFWLGGDTTEVNIFVSPLDTLQQGDPQFQSYRNYILTNASLVEARLNELNPGKTKFKIIDGPLIGTRGYKNKTMNIQVTWRNVSSGPIAQGENWEIGTYPKAFDSQLNFWTTGGAITVPVNSTSKAMYVANTMLHEVAHCVLDAMDGRQLGGFRDHTSSGLMAGGLDDNLSFNDASQSLLDYDDGTKTELRAALGYDWMWW